MLKISPAVLCGDEWEIRTPAERTAFNAPTASAAENR
jgi:hypothetical protein